LCESHATSSSTQDQRHRCFAAAAILASRPSFRLAHVSPEFTKSASGHAFSAVFLSSTNNQESFRREVARSPRRISIVTSVLLHEYLAGSIVVLMLSGGEALGKLCIAQCIFLFARFGGTDACHRAS
jgi:hypothetical protein